MIKRRNVERERHSLVSVVIRRKAPRYATVQTWGENKPLCAIHVPSRLKRVIGIPEIPL
jgi:hypothetical protein